MKPRFLLDTNVVSEPIRKQPDAAVVRRIEQHERRIALAAPVWHELVFGAEVLEPSNKRARIESYLFDVVAASFPVLPYNQHAAHLHAAERARLRRIGREPPFVDGQIAAIARANDLTLITRNIQDFQCFAELRVESWFAES